MGLGEPSVHNLQSSKLLRNKENRLSFRQGYRNQIANGLRLSCTWWSVYDDVFSGKGIYDSAVLGRVSIKDKGNIDLGVFIDIVVLRKEGAIPGIT